MADRPAEPAPPEGPVTEGVGGSRLPPRIEDQRTDEAPDTHPPEGPATSPAAEPRPWIVVALALLVFFIVGLGYAVILPLLQ